MRSFPRRHAPRTGASRRAQLLVEFDRGGLSASAFARRCGIHTPTFAAGVSAGPTSKLCPPLETYAYPSWRNATTFVGPLNSGASRDAYDDKSLIRSLRCSVPSFEEEKILVDFCRQRFQFVSGRTLASQLRCNSCIRILTGGGVGRG